MNLSVTTKFGIVFLLAPFVIAVSFFSASYLLLYLVYGITPDLSPDLVPSLISMILVWLLVWERLRGSLRRDLRWFHKYVLFKLYEGFGANMNFYYIQKKDIKRLRADLEEYGQSMGLPLYPRKLPEMMDKFLELNENFSTKLEKIEKWGQKELGEFYNFFPFLHHLGIEPIRERDRSSSIERVVNRRKDMAQKLLQEQPELVNGTRDLLQKIRVTREQIHDILDDFIKDNKLRLEPKPSYVGYPRY